MKRTIPRHVDGRVKIGYMPIKNFLKVIPIYIFLLFVILLNPRPMNAFICIVIGLLIYFLGSELNNKETGLDIVKDIIRYEKEGDIYFERNTLSKAEHKKIINNKLSKKILNGEINNDK